MKKLAMFSLCAMASVSWCMKNPNSLTPSAPTEEQEGQSGLPSTNNVPSSLTSLSSSSFGSSSSSLTDTSASTSIRLAEAPVTPEVALLLRRVLALESRNQQLEAEHKTNEQLQKRITVALEDQAEETRRIRQGQAWDRVTHDFDRAKTGDEKCAACVGCLCYCIADACEEAQRRNRLEAKSE